MAKPTFSEILIQLGFTPNDAIRHEFVLDSLIAEEIRQTIDEKVVDDDMALQKVIVQRVRTVYSDYIECVTQDLHLGQSLLAKEKLQEYLSNI
jgi:hypothetical protein